MKKTKIPIKDIKLNKSGKSLRSREAEQDSGDDGLAFQDITLGDEGSNQEPIPCKRAHQTTLPQIQTQEATARCASTARLRRGTWDWNHRQRVSLSRHPRWSGRRKRNPRWTNAEKWLLSERFGDVRWWGFCRWEFHWSINPTASRELPTVEEEKSCGSSVQASG